MFDESSDLKKLSYAQDMAWDKEVYLFVMDALESEALVDADYAEFTEDGVDRFAASLAKTKAEIVKVGGPNIPLKALATLYVYEVLTGHGNGPGVAKRTMDDVSELLSRPKELSLIHKRVASLAASAVKEYFEQVNVVNKKSLDSGVVSSLRQRNVTLALKAGASTGQRNMIKRLFVSDGSDTVVLDDEVLPEVSKKTRKTKAQTEKKVA